MYRFGAFEVNEAAGELRKGGTRIKLHAQPFQVLVLLLERPSELVTREEMRQRLWPQDTFVDFDHSLNTAVNKLRQALGDSAAQPRYIETVPGRGYRFIAPVALPERLPDRPANPSEAPQQEIPAVEPANSTLLTLPHELPRAPRQLVRILLLLVQDRKSVV